MANDQLPLDKLCRKCGVEKPATSEFFKRTRYGGLTSPCRACQRAHQAAHNKANPERNRQRAAAWYHSNTQRAKEARRKYYVQNREKFAVRFRQRYLRNIPETVAKARKWKADNLLRWNISRKAWVERNRQKVRAIQAACGHKRRAAVLASSRHFTASDISKMLLAQKQRCWWCCKPLTKYHVDHRIPLARGGSNGPENIVISCPRCNQRKNAKMPWEFESGRLL